MKKICKTKVSDRNVFTRFFFRDFFCGSTRAQLSIEYVFLMGIGFIFLLFAIIYVGDQMVEISENTHRELVMDIAYSIQSELSFASRATQGYKREFYVPLELNNIEYNISQLGRELVITTDRFEFGVDIPLVEGNVSKGFNTIRNFDGKLCIEPNC